MAWEKRIETVLGDIRRDFNLALSRKEFGNPKLGEYGSFLSVCVHPPVAPRSGVEPCPASKLPHKECYGDYKAKHDHPHIHKSDTTDYGHEATMRKDISYNHMASFDDTLAEFTLCEARNLKNAADHLKVNGDVVEISEIYLHAGLKFLKAAYLTSTSDAFDRYIDAVKLFQYSAENYENNGKVEVAALAYKCMEIAYLRVAFALAHICSCGQDLLNMGEIGMSCNMKLKNDNDNAAHLKQLLSISKYVSAAMDASIKSCCALEHAVQYHSCTKGHEIEGLSSVKKAIDFSFSDMEEFVRLILLSLKDVGI